jgi:drug/metabolite transporter (DMT)-like permease
MVCGGLLLVLTGTITGEWPDFHPSRMSILSIGAFVYLVLIGAVVGFTAYIWLLHHCDPAKVATYAYVNPIVAVLLGAAFAGETLTLRTIIAAALIIGSVALVITVQQLRASTKAPPVPATVPEAECSR